MNRKNENMPEPLDSERIWSIFQRMVYHPETEQSKRVAEILDRMAILRGNAPSQEKMGVKAQLDRLLSKYKWGVMVSPSKQGLVTVFYPADRSLTGDDRWEYEAVRMLPYLGERPRIRRCEECGEWLYAGRNAKQRFCDNNGRCRQHAWDSKPGHKERKRRNAEKSRASQKELDAGAKKAVGYTKPMKRRAKVRG